MSKRQQSKPGSATESTIEPREPRPPVRRGRRIATALALTLLSLCGLAGQASASPGALTILLVEPNAPPTTLQNALRAQSGVATVDYFDAGAATPSDSVLAAYDVVVAMSDQFWLDNTAMGNNLADYQDQGGVAVGATFVWQDSSGFTLAGRWITAGYSPYQTGGTTSFSTATLGTHDPTSPLLQGVNSLSAFYRNTLTLAPGATQIAAWSDGNSAVAVQGNALGINAYLGEVEGSGNWSGDFARLIVNAGNVLGRHTLTVTKRGNGSGTVTSSPAGINCGATCATNYTNGTLVTLSATPTGGSFTGWSGSGCGGTSTCTITMDGAKTVTATFRACVVPKLKGKTLRRARKSLGKHGCHLGKVKGPRSGRVKKQRPKPGAVRRPGSRVRVKLG